MREGGSRFDDITIWITNVYYNTVAITRHNARGTVARVSRRITGVSKWDGTSAGIDRSRARARSRAPRIRRWNDQRRLIAPDADGAENNGGDTR